ncbi:MAG: hypothetical protein BWY62_00607 [Firmicutes bacterium ADurb.Bin356]|nr:MAG: hypothetical protein BWY62_00607 [Firmicutes bacterium ADurb.Bin356]
MESYKIIIKRRCLILNALALICAAFIVVFRFGFSKLFAGNEVFNFQEGLLSAFVLLPLIKAIRYHKAQKDETALRKLYNDENDERKKFIRQKSGMPLMQITSGLMIFAGIIIGYVNKTIFYTLVFAAMAQMTIAVIIKTFYMKKL